MILFRCDSSFQIGTGHVARCLNLAQILKPLEFEIEFVCEDRPGHVMSKIKSAGFKVHSVRSGQDLHLVQNLKPQWLIIDHYEIDSSWEKQVPAQTRIFVIDDLANRSHQCDVLLDQNYRTHLPDYKSLVPAQCQLLLGPQYSLLRSELTLKPEIKSLSSQPTILVFFGGSDESGETLKLAQAVQNLNMNFTFQLVGLSSQKQIQALQALSLPPSVKLLVDPPNWIELLKNADFYIGGGGTVTWERLFLGLPGAVLAVADNQFGPSRDLANEGYQHFWGRSQDFNYSELGSKLEAIFSHPDDLKNMARKGQSLISKFDLKAAQSIFGPGT